MKIAIVDDDKIWRECIRAELLSYDYEEIQIDLFVSGEKYLCGGMDYDISFIDIEMPGIDGFETISRARTINGDNGIYVILTTHAEMSRKGYFVNAFRYIDKVHLEELKEAMDSAIKVLGRNEKIIVNVIGDGPREIVLKNIIYIETEKHYILIHTHKGIIKCSNNMYDMENMLPDKWFCRCHNVYIVNLDEIVGFEERIIYLSNGDDIDVSYRKMKEFKKMYINRQYECANA